MIIDYQSGKIVSEINDSCVFAELSFAIETSLNWLFGKGSFKFELHCHKKSNKIFLTVNSLVPVGKLQMSHVASIGLLLKEKIFPLNISESWRSNERHIDDGQNRIERVTESVIETTNLEENMTIGLLVYGISDMITGLICRGVKHFKWQGSKETLQLWCKHTLSDKELTDYLKDHIDYNPQEIIGKIILK